MARALGETQAGERLIAAMDATLRDLATNKPQQIIRVASWNGGGAVPRKGSLFDAILTAAGGVNIAASLPNTRDGSFDIEQLLMAHPDVLAYGTDANKSPALRDDADQHPLIMKLYARRRVYLPRGTLRLRRPGKRSRRGGIARHVIGRDAEPAAMKKLRLDHVGAVAAARTAVPDVLVDWARVD